MHPAQASTEGSRCLESMGGRLALCLQPAELWETKNKATNTGPTPEPGQKLLTQSSVASSSQILSWPFFLCGKDKEKSEDLRTGNHVTTNILGFFLQLCGVLADVPFLSCVGRAGVQVPLFCS